MDSADLRYWDFSFDPFEDGARSDLLFLSQEHREAIDRLRRGVAEARRAIYLGGSAGSGKSFLLSSLQRWLERNGHLVAILSEEQPERYLLEPLLKALRFEQRGVPNHELLPVLKAFLARIRRDHGVQTVLLLDRVTFPADERSRAEADDLLSLQRNGAPIITIIFTGRFTPQEAERQVVNGFWQNVEVAHTLGAMSESETRQYLEHRLRLAGCWQALFEPDACCELHRLSGGLPGAINALCRRALDLARARSVRLVSRDLLSSVQDRDAGVAGPPPLPRTNLPENEAIAASPSALTRASPPPTGEARPPGRPAAASRAAGVELPRSVLRPPVTTGISPPPVRAVPLGSGMRAALRESLERCVLRQPAAAPRLAAENQPPHAEPSPPEDVSAVPPTSQDGRARQDPIGNGDQSGEPPRSILLTHFLRRKQTT